eukprot:scaffold686430_cov47-Attheya_sp.AAC.2
MAAAARPPVPSLPVARHNNSLPGTVARDCSIARIINSSKLRILEYLAQDFGYLKYTADRCSHFRIVETSHKK